MASGEIYNWLHDVLTPEPRASAYRAANTEWAWTRDDAIAVARLVSKRLIAVWGGEGWYVTGHGGWTLTPGGVMEWSCERSGDEPWSEFCVRSVAFAEDQLAFFAAMERQMPEPERVRWNLTFVTEVEYEGSEALIIPIGPR